MRKMPFFSTKQGGGTSTKIPKSAYPNAYPFVPFRFSVHTLTHTQMHTQTRVLTFKRQK